MNYANKPRPPQYMEIWTKACTSVVKISLKSRKDFQRLRAQLYALRKTLEADKDPLFEQLKHLSITSEVVGQIYYLKVGPADLDLRKQLATQGITGDSLVQQSAESKALISKYGDDFLDPTK